MGDTANNGTAQPVKKKASERYTELAAEGIPTDEAKILVKHEIKKGLTVDDAGPDVEAVNRDASQLAELISPKRDKTAKGGQFGGEEDEEDEYGDDEEGGEEDEEDEEGAMGKAGRGRQGRRGDREGDREERLFIRRMAAGIEKAVRRSLAKQSSVDEGLKIMKAQGRLMVSQAGQIAQMHAELSKARGELKDTRDELEMLKGSLSKPDGTFKAKTGRDDGAQVIDLKPVRSPYDGKPGQGGQGNGGSGDQSQVVGYDELEQYLHGALRKAQKEGDSGKLAALKTVAAEMSIAGADLNDLARRAGFSKAS